MTLDRIAAEDRTGVEQFSEINCAHLFQKFSDFEEGQFLSFSDLSQKRAIYSIRQASSSPLQPYLALISLSEKRDFLELKAILRAFSSGIPGISPAIA